jgi:hypothetical protein
MSTTFKFPQSASLARRLAEAADGLRNVNRVYFIAGLKFPHPTKDFPDLDSAKVYFSDKDFSEDEYAIFGPYKTTDELDKLNLVGVEDIKKVELTVYFEDGAKKTITLPGGIDTIFFNLSAFEKFAFPYYCHLFGVEYAKKLRDNLIANYKADTGGGHIMSAVDSPHSYGTYSLKLHEGELLP